VDRSALTEWAAAISTVDQTILDAPATSLPIPAPEDTRGSAEADIAAAAGADALAEIWAPQIVENPFAVVFDVVELFRQLRGDIYGNLPRAGDEVEFAVGLVARMRDFHLEQLAFASAGNAILRRLWRALDDGDTSTVANADLSTARERVARALGLAPDPNASGFWLPPTRWHPPRTAADVLDAVGPSVTPHELPLTDSQAVAKRSNEKVPGEPTGGRRGMVLGRDMYVCPFKLVSFKNRAGKITYVYSGPAFRGRVDPVSFATRHAAEIGLPGGTDLFQRCVRVATQIAGNEGFLDACRSADRGLISTGMQQWSMHNNNEMTVLLHRFQDRAWDHYDLFFGMWGSADASCWRTRSPTHRPRSTPPGR